MTTPKFTPGPWVAVNTHPGQWAIAPRDYAKFTSSWTLAYIRDFQANDEANATLIASAPDLYAALQKAIDDLEALGWNPDASYRAALAKARGLKGGRVR